MIRWDRFSLEPSRTTTVNRVEIQCQRRGQKTSDNNKYEDPEPDFNVHVFFLKFVKQSVPRDAKHVDRQKTLARQPECVLQVPEDLLGVQSIYFLGDSLRFFLISRLSCRFVHNLSHGLRVEARTVL